MKKISVFILIFLFTINVFAQNPKEIVEKCVSALGGEEALKKFSNYQAKGEIKLAMRGTGELAGKLDAIQSGIKSWRKVELAFGKEIYTMTQAYDGKAAWMDRLGTIVDQPTLNYESDSDHSFFLLFEKDAVLSFAKEKEIEGKRAIGVEVDFKGKKTTLFIDPETYTILEMVYKDLYFGDKFTKETLERSVRYGDYKKLDGVFFPTKMTIYQDGKKQAEFSYSEVNFNPQVAAAKFARPEQKLDLRYREEVIN